jgi:hypothetical protein
MAGEVVATLWGGTKGPGAGPFLFAALAILPDCDSIPLNKQDFNLFELI